MAEANIPDHALVRWLERAHGIEIEELRKILRETAQRHVDAGVAHVFEGGVWFVYRGETLVTVVEERPSPAAIRHHDRETRNGTDAPREQVHWKHAKRKKRRG